MGRGGREGGRGWVAVIIRFHIKINKIYKLSGAATPLGQGQQMVLIISNEKSSPKCSKLQQTA